MWMSHSGTRNDAALDAETAEILLHKALVLGSNGKMEHAGVVLDDLLDRFESIRDPSQSLREVAANALYNKVAVLSRLGKGEDVIALVTDLLRCFDSLENPTPPLPAGSDFASEQGRLSLRAQPLRRGRRRLRRPA
jgi:hypothetical protein